MISSDKVDSALVYVIAGAAVRELLEALEAAQLQTVRSDLVAKKGKNGTTIGFASKLLFYGIEGGDTAAWIIPAQPQPNAPGL